MSAVESASLNASRASHAQGATHEVSRSSALARLMALLCSVRFGVSLLVLLVVACTAGMLVMQQGVEGFAAYYAALPAWRRELYGALSLFDIYHSWYFNLLLVILSLNIVLSSIDRFPGAWNYISRKKLEASRAYILHQAQHASLELMDRDAASLAARAEAACRALKLKPVLTSKGARLYIFAERRAWNRLGAYAVHAALLTIFAGGFLTAQFGETGQVRLMPGISAAEMSRQTIALDQVTQVGERLPFTLSCTDIQQKLIDRAGTIQGDNTIDWLTRFTIRDETGEREAVVRLNKPYDYRGYRFFQANFVPLGSARSITLRLVSQSIAGPESGPETQDVLISRNGEARLADGTRIEFINFFPDFRIVNGRPDTASPEYRNPAAQLRVTAADGEQRTAYAFLKALPDGAPVGNGVAGYKLSLADFEKAPLAHVLSVQHDPGMPVVYLGFLLLALTLAAVFLFAHERVWMLIEEHENARCELFAGGHTNRNKLAFEDRFKRLVEAIEKQE